MSKRTWIPDLNNPAHIRMLNVQMDELLHKMQSLEQDRFLAAHPVGALYSSVDANPADLYGGEWIEIDREYSGEYAIVRWLRTK